ncbi:MAG TPA: cbb3-type cytochrome c oxidase N-terminal domain-containing protein [Longimicrobiales bacterium]|nr:cbb3-type cytochrome c oxidase N-terminal domain-containing protein [Longimicrobiales bacterium]
MKDRKDEQKDRILGHADEADGIEEYDNPLPDWWVGLFWLTIIWAVAYTLHYHVIGGRSQENELAAEMARAEVRWPTSGQPADFVVTPELATAGRTVYQTNCAACHGMALEGGIGVALNDGDWVHGGEPEDVLRSISEGVPAKGMPAWGPILGPERVRQVAAYILSEQQD